MRYFLALVLSLGAFAGLAGADEWKQGDRLESTGKIHWVDINHSGDGVMYVCDAHDAYLYDTKRKKSIPVVPPANEYDKTHNSFATNALFLDDEWIIHDGLGKYTYSFIGTKNVIVPKALKVKHNVRLYGRPDFVFVKAQNGAKALLYTPPLREGDPPPSPKELSRSFVYVVSHAAFMSVPIHSREVGRGYVAAKLEAVAISPEGNFLFTAGDRFVTRWNLGVIPRGEKIKCGNFDLPTGRIAGMAASNDAVAVAMENGPIVYAVDMKDPRELSADTSVVAEKSAKIVNRCLALSGDGRSVFVARDRLTNTSETIHEVVLVGPDTPYKQLLAREAAIKQVRLADEQTLVCLDAAGWLGFIPMGSGSVAAEPTWFNTELADAIDFRLSADGNTVVVYGSKDIAMYHRNGSKEKLAVK